MKPNPITVGFRGKPSRKHLRQMLGSDSYPTILNRHDHGCLIVVLIFDTEIEIVAILNLLPHRLFRITKKIYQDLK